MFGISRPKIIIGSQETALKAPDARRYEKRSKTVLGYVAASIAGVTTQMGLLKQSPRLGSSRRADCYMSPKAVRQPNCCRVVERDV